MQPGTLVAGKYRVERIIGRGGMGLVAEATHLALGNRVALKFLAAEIAADPTALARFRREARATAQLQTEHVCRVFDVGVEGQTPFIVMELLSGTDLARLSKVRTLDVATAALYIKQACAGLAEAHAANIVHRDLKPGNLFITRRPDGTALIKILDFGVAKAPQDGDIKLTGTSNVVGSAGFMSPEQFRSSKSVDGRTDVWSLGVILYKLVSGRLPFKADGFAEFALAITRDDMPPLPEAPAAFVAVVARCLEKDPAKRYPDVHALADALAPFAAQGRRSAPVIPVDLPVGDEVSSGIGGAPDSVDHTLLLGAAPRTPAPARPAPTPPSAANQTVLGVSQVQVTRLPAPVAPAMKVTVAETAVPVQTVSGTAMGERTPHCVPAGELTEGTVVGEYCIDGKIGEGGMGVVYSATHPLIGKRAAIKVISAELGTEPVLVQRFVQEARSVNQIGHPNIVDVFAFGNLPDGRNYFVMEFLQGESLRGRLTRAFMSIADAVQILDEIAGALEAAHENGIVHRDLKPDNVFLASVRGGYIMVKLLDFGIAKLVTEGGIAKTSTGEMMGTPGYLSPEQARGRNVDCRTDIYALGCMMYEMITGRVPFMGESPMDIVMMHITTPPAKPSVFKPDIPPLLEQLILEMLDKDPDRRPSLSHTRNVFAELVASGHVQIEPGSASTFRSDLARRRGDSEIRTPRRERREPTPAPSTAAPDAPTLGRQRVPSPSEQPTQIAFTPGPDTLAPAAGRAPAAAHERRAGWIAIVVVAALVPAVTIGFALIRRDGRAAGDAGLAAATQEDAGGAVAVAAEAAVGNAAAPLDAGADALLVVLRSVEIRVDAPAARVEVDGETLPVVAGVARVSLTDGPHRVTVSANGHVTVTRRLEVASSPAPLEIHLEPKPGRTPAAVKRTGTNAHDKNYTLDPFAD